jgi:hypothetical protein
MFVLSRLSSRNLLVEQCRFDNKTEDPCIRL